MIHPNLKKDLLLLILCRKIQLSNQKCYSETIFLSLFRHVTQALPSVCNSLFTLQVICTDLDINILKTVTNS